MAAVSAWTMWGVVFAMMALWTGGILWAVKAVVSTQFAGLKETLDKAETHREELQQRLTKLQILLPQEYVQRPDWIRFSNVIDAKQDLLREAHGSMGAKLDKLILQIESLERDREHHKQS